MLEAWIKEASTKDFSGRRRTRRVVAIDHLSQSRSPTAPCPIPNPRFGFQPPRYPLPLHYVINRNFVLHLDSEVLLRLGRSCLIGIAWSVRGTHDDVSRTRDLFFDVELQRTRSRRRSDYEHFPTTTTPGNTITAALTRMTWAMAGGCRDWRRFVAHFVCGCLSYSLMELWFGSASARSSSVFNGRSL